MALDVLEWGVILVMGASILIWGPEKIPDIAKQLARAKKEFDGATKQLQGITKELQTGINAGNLNLDTLSNAIMGAGTAAGIPGNPSPGQVAKATASSPVSVTPTGAATGAAAGVTTGGATSIEPASLPGPSKKSADQMLIDMAKSLKISTQGMTREEISKAIMDTVENKPAQVAPAESPPVAPAEAQPPVEAKQPDVQPEAPATQ